MALEFPKDIVKCSYPHMAQNEQSPKIRRKFRLLVTSVTYKIYLNPFLFTSQRLGGIVDLQLTNSFLMIILDIYFENLETCWYTCLEYEGVRLRQISYLILFVKLTDFKPFMPQRTLYIPCTMKVHSSQSKYNHSLEGSKSTFIQKYALVPYSNLFGIFTTKSLPKILPKIRQHNPCKMDYPGGFKAAP